MIMAHRLFSCHEHDHWNLDKKHQNFVQTPVTWSGNQERLLKKKISMYTQIIDQQLTEAAYGRTSRTKQHRKPTTTHPP